MFGGDRAAGNQSTAADANKQDVERADFVDQFKRRRALAGHHVRMVERWNQRHAALVGELAADRFAVLFVSVEQLHYCSVAARGVDLHLRRIGWHQNRGRNAEQARRQRNRLGMIARRECDDTRPALFGRELRQRVVSAAKLERAHALQVFAFEKEPSTGAVIGGARSRHRRSVRNAVQARRGSLNVCMIDRQVHTPSLTSCGRPAAD